MSSNQVEVIVVQWLKCRTCSHKIEGSNPTKLSTSFTLTRIVTESQFLDLCKS